MNYRLVSERELEVRKGEVILSLDEMAEIIAIQDILVKFLNKSQVSLMLSLSTGQHRWKEEVIYNKVEWLEELKKSIKETEKNMISYKKQKEEKETKK